MDLVYEHYEDSNSWFSSKYYLVGCTKDAFMYMSCECRME